MLFLLLAGFSGRALSAPAALPGQMSPSITWIEPDQLGPDPYSPTQPLPQDSPPQQPRRSPAPVPVEAPEVDINGAKQSIGRPDVAPIVEVITTYDDNIFITPTNRKSDVYTTVVAGLGVGWGDFRDQLTQLGAFQETYEGLRSADYDLRSFLFASYTPGYTAFLKNSDENTVDHDATIGARWLFGGLVTDVRARYRLYSEALQDSGTRVRQSEFNIAVDSRYAFSARTSVEADLNLITHHYNQSGLVGSSEWIDRNYLNYQVMPKTNIAAGATFGYIAVDSGPDQTYEQILTRLTYDTEHHLSAKLFGGVEFRQFSGAGTDTNPVFGLEVNYEPFDGTDVRLSASRLVTNSAEYVGQNIVNTGFTLSVSQELWKKVSFTIHGGYGEYAYGNAGGAGTVDRTDDGLQLGCSLAFHLTAHVAVTLAYNYSHNESTAERFNFDDNRATLDLNLLF